MPRWDQDRAPRNYYSIAPPDRRDIHRAPSPRWNEPDPQSLIGLLELCLETQSPLHVGNGAFTLHHGELVKDFVRCQGKPVVPGSSIKGAVRQVFEVLTSSDDPWSEGKGEGHRLSPAGRVFGALGYRGRVCFSDAVLDDEVELMQIQLSVPYTPGKRETGRRFYGPMPEGADQPRSIPALALPAGVQLWTRLQFDSVSKKELGAVLWSLGLCSTVDGDRGFELRLGGGRYDGNGRVRVMPSAYKIRPPGQICLRWPEHDEPDEVRGFVEQMMKEFTPQPCVKDALEHLRRSSGA